MDRIVAEPTNTASVLLHSVMPRNGEYLVAYPTPGIEAVPTLALICRTEAQAVAEAQRLNGVEVLQ